MTAKSLTLLSLLIASIGGAGCAPSSNDDGAGKAGNAAGGGAGAGSAGSGGTGGIAGGAARGGSGGTGIGGTTGTAGTGAAGVTGAAGTTGGAGMGTAGASGASGTSGSGGASGAGGRGGNTGAAGSAGAGGGIGGSGGGSAGRGGAGGRGGGTQDGSVSDGAPDGMSDGGTVYMPCPTTPGTACVVLPLGDSITEGYLPSGANGGYRVELFRQAVLAGKNITFVGTQMNGPTTVESRTFPRRHEGRGGYTIAGGGQGAIAGTVTATAISTYRPHIVLLMIGTNDINGNINVASAPTRLGQLIDEITTGAPAALVVVATIIPVADNNTNQRVQTYNGAIPGLVNARAAAGKHVLFLDNYGEFVKDPSYRTSLMVDSLHPNAAGYAVLGRAFQGAISAVLPGL